MNTVFYGTMGGLPIDQALRHIQQSCFAVQASLARIPAPGRESFGRRISQAVRARVQSRFSPVIASTDNDDDFAQRLKKAAEQPRKQHEEQVERERNRYKKPRPRTKSD